MAQSEPYEDPGRLKFLVNIESVTGHNLVSNSRQRPCTYLKIKFDESYTIITTESVPSEENPVWKGLPHRFEYETLFHKQNQLKVKQCVFEVWDKPSIWSRPCEDHLISADNVLCDLF